jgi:hypothetical protein
MLHMAIATSVGRNVRKIMGDNIRTSVKDFIRELEQDREKTVEHLKSISGPTGMRNSLASAIGLAENSLRTEIILQLKEIIKDES